MKKIISVSLAMLLAAGMLFSLVGCTNEPTEEEPTTVFERMETVSEDNVVSYINELITKTNAAAPVINVSENFNVSDTMALTNEDYELYLQGAERTGDTNLETLDDTLGFIKTYLMKGFSAPAPEFTEVTAIDEADVAEVVNYNIYTARNWTSENVTNEEGESYAYEEDATKYRFDEDGNELLDEPVTNEDGEAEIYETGDIVSKSYVCDNKLNVTLSFLAKQDEESAAPVFADAAIINKYFTNTVDKDYVLSELAKVNTAVAVSDYSVEYLDCTIFFNVDMETEQILSMTLTKNAFVTFDAQGEGSFADLGEFKLAFTFRDTVNLSFDYTAEEAEDDSAAADVISDGDVVEAEEDDIISDGDAVAEIELPEAAE